MLKLGFAGRWSPLEKTSWSGTYFYAFQALQKHFNIRQFQYEWPWLLRERLIFHKQIQKLAHKKVAVEFLRDYARWFSRQLEKDLVKYKPDILFVPAAPQLIAYCKTRVPIIFVTDASFYQLQGYYDSFDNLAPYNIRQGTELDRRAFEQAAHCMLASGWAADSAINDYHIPRSKITVVPFGANLDIVPAADELNFEKNEKCRLLFLGVEWERKGGQIALDTFFQLQQSGLPVELTIVGCTPPEPLNDKHITIIPFINKHNKEEARQLYNIFLESNFLLLPTRAECAGIVFCEASAFGVPSVTTNTGGVSTYVKDGINGFALPREADAGAYAAKIAELFADTDSYRQLCISSRKRFEEELNWDSWAKTFSNIAERIVNL